MQIIPDQAEPTDLLSQDPRQLAEPTDLLSQDPRQLAEPTDLLSAVPPRPKCKFGAACNRPQCAFDHTAMANTKLCRNGNQCNNKACTFVHPAAVATSAKLCRNGNQCNNEACTFVHPPGPRYCQHGSKCWSKKCTWIHPPGWSVAEPVPMPPGWSTEAVPTPPAAQAVPMTPVVPTAPIVQTINQQPQPVIINYIMPPNVPAAPVTNNINVTASRPAQMSSLELFRAKQRATKASADNIVTKESKKRYLSKNLESLDADTVKSIGRILKIKPETGKSYLTKDHVVSKILRNDQCYDEVVRLVRDQLGLKNLI